MWLEMADAGMLGPEEDVSVAVPSCCKVVSEKDNSWWRESSLQAELKEREITHTEDRCDLSVINLDIMDC